MECRGINGRFLGRLLTGSYEQRSGTCLGPDKAGGPISGDLPSRIAPSPIEFQAYVKQFVEYFHRAELLKQGFLADGVILFYPLKTSLAGGPAASSIKKVTRTERVDYHATPCTSNVNARTCLTNSGWHGIVAQSTKRGSP
jgi:hypothetical protein